MKYIDFDKGLFVTRMLIVDPRTGNGGYGLVKCPIEDAIASELVTQQEVDAARLAKLDQKQEGSNQDEYTC